MIIDNTKESAEAVNALDRAGTEDEKARALRDLINAVEKAANEADTPFDQRRFTEASHYYRGALHAIIGVGVFA